MSGNIKYIGEGSDKTVKPLPTSGYISQSNSDGKDAALNKFISSFTQEGSFGTKNTKTEMVAAFPELSQILTKDGPEEVKKKLQVKQEPANSKDCSVFTVSEKSSDLSTDALGQPVNEVSSQQTINQLKSENKELKRQLHSQHLNVPATTEEKEANVKNITDLVKELQENSQAAEKISGIEELVQELETQVQILEQTPASGNPSTSSTQTGPGIVESKELTDAANNLTQAVNSEHLTTREKNLFGIIGTQKEFVYIKVNNLLSEVLSKLTEFENKNADLEAQNVDLKSQIKDVRALNAQILALNTTIDSLTQVIGFDKSIDKSIHKKLYESQNPLLAESLKAKEYAESVMNEVRSSDARRQEMEQDRGTKPQQPSKVKNEEKQMPIRGIINPVVRSIDETELKKGKIKDEIIRLAETYYSKDMSTKERNMNRLKAELNQRKNNNTDELQIILNAANKGKFIEGGSKASRRKRFRSRKAKSHKKKTKTRRYRKRSFTRRRK